MIHMNAYIKYFYFIAIFFICLNAHSIEYISASFCEDQPELNIRSGLAEITYNGNLLKGCADKDSFLKNSDSGSVTIWLQVKAGQAECESLKNQNYTTYYQNSCWHATNTAKRNIDPLELFEKKVNEFGASGITAGNTSSSTLKQIQDNIAALDDEYRDTCDDRKEYAVECCNDPRKCMDSQYKDSSPESQSFASKLGQTYFKFQDMAAMVSQTLTMTDSSSKACEVMKNLTHLGSLTHSALSLTCESVRGACQKQCRSKGSEARSILSQLGAGSIESRSECRNAKIGNMRPSASEFPPTEDGEDPNYRIQRYADEVRKACEDAFKVASAYEKNEKACGKGLSGATMNIIAQGALSSTMAEKFNICENQIKGTDTGFETPVVEFDGDCSKIVNQTNPICVQCMRNPDAEFCKDIYPYNQRGGGTPSIAGDPLSDDIFGEDDTFDGLGELDIDDVEVEELPIVEANAGLGLNSTGGGGGAAGIGAGGPGAGGISQNSANRNPASKGYDTDILKGERGGNGYTGGGFSSAGGFGGYGNGRNKDDIDRDPKSNIFDKMRKAIDKAKGDVFGRKPTSKSLLGMMDKRNRRGIGGKHENIFEIVSDTYKTMCVAGDMFVCEANYENFNYYKHSEFVRNSYLLELSLCQKNKKSCTKQDEREYINELTNREAFLHKHYKGKFRKLFSVKSYRKGQPVKTVPRSCRVNDESCIQRRYKSFVYTGNS